GRGCDWDLDRTQRCGEATRSGLAMVAAGETERRKSGDQPRRASHRAIAGFMVRRWDRAQRLADEVRCDELPAARQNRISVASKAEQESLDFFALRQQQSQAFAGAAGFKEFGHREPMTPVAAISQNSD